ncbi:hypothetical protein ACFL96_02185 [Thermoproteota archaeon]
MSKKELQEKAEFEKAVGLKAGFISTILSILKLVLGIALLPFVIGLTRSFYHELMEEAVSVRRVFYWGIATYLVLHLFAFKLQGFFDAGQRIIGKLFGFFVPLRRVMYVCLPVYSTLFFVIYFIWKTFFNYRYSVGYFLFGIAFMATMHLVLTANSLREGPSDSLRGGYICSLFLLYIVNIIVLCAFLHFMLEGFSFLEFIKQGFDFFIKAITFSWKQLFALR